jgi:hypothetical protein
MPGELRWNRTSARDMTRGIVSHYPEVGSTSFRSIQGKRNLLNALTSQPHQTRAICAAIGLDVAMFRLCLDT